MPNPEADKANARNQPGHLDEWQTFAWAGFQLEILTVWNPAKVLHKQGEGLIALADLRQVQLEIRWKTTRAALRLHARLIRRLKTRGAVMTAALAEGGAAPRLISGPAAANSFTRVDHQGKSSLLMHTRSRLYELNFPHESSHVQSVAQSFRDVTSSDFQPWQIFNARALIPATFPLETFKLLPGSIELHFKRGRNKISTGSWSLADRLLAGRTLVEFARQTVPLLKSTANARKTTWVNPSPGEATCSTPARSLVGSRTHTFHLLHDAGRNSIQWLYILASSKIAPELQKTVANFWNGSQADLHPVLSGKA